MVNHRLGATGMQCHVQRCNHEVCRHVFTKCPAHHLAAVGIDHHGQVDEPHPGRDVGHVSYPQLVDTRGNELTLDQVRRWPGVLSCHAAWSPRIHGDD